MASFRPSFRLARMPLNTIVEQPSPVTDPGGDVDVATNPISTVPKFARRSFRWRPHPVQPDFNDLYEVSGSECDDDDNDNGDYDSDCNRNVYSIDCDELENAIGSDSEFGNNDHSDSGIPVDMPAALRRCNPPQSLPRLIIPGVPAKSPRIALTLPKSTQSQIPIPLSPKTLDQLTRILDPLPPADMPPSLDGGDGDESSDQDPDRCMSSVPGTPESSVAAQIGSSGDSAVGAETEWQHVHIAGDRLDQVQGDVRGNGHSVDVQWQDTDAYEREFDIHGQDLDIRGRSIDIRGLNIDICGSDIGINGRNVDILRQDIDFPEKDIGIHGDIDITRQGVDIQFSQPFPHVQPPLSLRTSQLESNYDENKGIQLPLGALTTLEQFDTASPDSPPDIDAREIQDDQPEISQEHPPEMKMKHMSWPLWVPQPNTSLTSSDTSMPCTPLSMPPPDGLCLDVPTDEPPMTAIAQGFYDCPFKDVPPVPPIPEQYVQPVYPDTVNPEGNQSVEPRPKCTDYDEYYQQNLMFQASAKLDQTSRWLEQQESHSSDTFDIADAPKGDSHSPPDIDMFSNCFETYIQQSKPHDAFVHARSRCEAVQANRLGLRYEHVNQLSGKLETAFPPRPKYSGPFTREPRQSTLPAILAEQEKWDKVEKTEFVQNQLNPAFWALDAARFLNRGHLLSTAATALLKRGPARVLDLGGHPHADWSWMLASNHPNADVYTALTISQAKVFNPAICGPSNHHVTSVPHLWRLPFPDGHFDIVSVRGLYAHLRQVVPVGESADEYDLCLSECARCLRPGGVLDFSVLDAEIVRAGPFGAAVSAEFEFELRSRSFDPAPTRSFVKRLVQKDDLWADVKRTQLFLPMAPAPFASGATMEIAKDTASDAAKQPAKIANNQAADATAKGAAGSTTAVSYITGLLGSWMWEQWLLRLQLECGRPQETLLKETAAVFAEAWGTGGDAARYGSPGAGWRCIQGYAIKREG